MKKNIMVKVSAFLASAVMAISAGTMCASADEAQKAIELTSTETLAGKIANVDLNLISQDECEGYTIAVEFDSALEFKRVNGGAVYQQEGNIVYITGFTPYSFKDGKVGSISFEVPEDAKENEVYDVRIMKVEDFGTLEGNYTDYTTKDAEIKVKEAATKTSNYMVFVTEINQEINIQMGMRGDVNNDGKVDIFDAIAVAQTTVGKTNVKSDAAKYFGNVNEDDNFDIFDAITIARYTTADDWADVIK